MAQQKQLNQSTRDDIEDIFIKNLDKFIREQNFGSATDEAMQAQEAGYLKPFLRLIRLLNALPEKHYPEQSAKLDEMLLNLDEAVSQENPNSRDDKRAILNSYSKLESEKPLKEEKIEFYEKFLKMAVAYQAQDAIDNIFHKLSGGQGSLQRGIGGEAEYLVSLAKQNRVRNNPKKEEETVKLSASRSSRWKSERKEPAPQAKTSLSSIERFAAAWFNR